MLVISLNSMLKGLDSLGFRVTFSHPYGGHLTFQTLVKLEVIFLNYRFDLNLYLQMV